MSATPPLPVVRDLRRLTSLRGFAALAVFLYHLARHTEWLPKEWLFMDGFAGVAFFFILSGFVLTWSAKPVIDRADFWMRRFARVYPSHLVTALVALTLPVLALPLTAAGVVANFSLTQAWFWPWEISFGVNAVSWSLSCEAFFYLIAPFVIARGRTLRTPTMLAVLALWLGLTQSTAFIAGVHSNRWDVYAYTNPAVRSGEFALGVALALLVQRGWRPRISAPAAIAVLTLAIGLSALYRPRVPQSVTDVIFVPFFALVILACAVADVWERRGVLQHPWLVYAGEVSFAFYLVHELAILNLAGPLGAGAGGPVGLALTVGVLMLCCLLAVVLHHVVELPAQRALVRSWRARRRRPAHSSP